MKKLREDLGWTQQDLAERARLSIWRVSRIERRVSIATDQEAAWLVQALTTEEGPSSPSPARRSAPRVREVFEPLRRKRSA